MTKIYAQGNYIVIEANNERKTFQKKGVGFEIVNYDGLYSLNDKGLPIGDFNYSEVKKEDGSGYATPLEFETFLFENTGNFNGGGSAPDLSITNKWKKEQLSGFTYNINIDSNELSYYELYFVKDDRSKDFSDPNFEVTNNSITINSGFPLDGVVCFYRKIEL